MRLNFHTYALLLAVFSVSLCDFAISFGQIRTNLSRFRVEVGTGYDTNLFKVADISAGNRVAALTETVEGKLSGWLYWNQRFRTYFSTSGSYSLYPANIFANEWQWDAKAKTSFTIKRRSRGSASDIKLNFAFGGMQVDQIFADRELGGENILDINDNSVQAGVQLGDLFDRRSYHFGAGVDFEINKHLAILVALSRETNDYQNINDPINQDIFSLDNRENNIEAALVFEPSGPLRMKLSYDGQDRQYRFKLARDGNGVEVLGTLRNYWTNLYGVDLYWNRPGIAIKVSGDGKQRIDKFSGYFNYFQKQLSGDLALTLSPNAQVMFGLKGRWKDYDRLTLNDTLLKNRYLTFEAGVNFKLRRNLVFETNFIHDRENSTFEGFNYYRNIIMAKFRYAIK